MKKIAEKLYFFTKLSSSIILFAVIILLIYLFYISYQKLEKNSNIIINEQINHNNNIINNQIKETNKLLSNLSTKIDAIEEEINNIKENNKLTNDDKFNEEIKRLNNKIEVLSKNILIENQDVNINGISNKTKLILNDYYHILNISLENGIDFSNTVEELLSITKNDSSRGNLEKLLIISYSNILSYKDLKKNFDISTDSFLKDYIILKSDYSYFMKVFLRFFSLKTDKQININDEKVKKISLARYYLNNKNLDKAINIISQLNENSAHYKKWIKDANKYVESLNLISKANESALGK